MNVERLTILRDHLASIPDEQLRMDAFYSKKTESGIWFNQGQCDDDLAVGDCGTAACVAGWAGFLFRGARGAYLEERAQEALDLSDDQRCALFRPIDYDFSAKYTRDDAVRTIDRLIETGRVDWTRPSPIVLSKDVAQ